MLSLPVSRMSVPQLQAAFLSILPRIITYARIVFRGERCPAHKDDCISETVATAWQAFVRLAERGARRQSEPPAHRPAQSERRLQ
jgi:hypothetical protein